MKTKLLLSLFFCLFTLPAFAAGTQTKTFGIHLFFDEKEFVDVLTLRREPDGHFSAGHMSVPNDFEGDIENLLAFGGEFSFELRVPKNASRPQDLVFVYRGRFFDEHEKQLLGYVTLKGKPDFVASFVGFQRE